MTWILAVSFVIAISLLSQAAVARVLSPGVKPLTAMFGLLMVCVLVPMLVVVIMVKLWW